VGRTRTPNAPERRRGPPRGAGAELREDLVDHRPLGHERDEAHRAVAGGAREGVDFKDLLQQRRPPTGGRLGLTPHPTRAVGVPAVVPRGDVPLVRYVTALAARLYVSRSSATGFLALTRARGGRDAAGGDAGDLAEQPAPIQTITRAVAW